MFILRWIPVFALSLLASCPLLAMSDDSIPQLLRQLQGPDNKVRAEAAMSLGKLGPTARMAVPALLEAVRDREPLVRSSAAWALGAIGGEARTVVPALIRALGDPDEFVRASAGSGLERFGPEAREAIPLLEKALKDPSAMVRSSAAGALGSIGPDSVSAVPRLMDLVRDEDAFVRSAAAGALGMIGPKAQAGVPALVAALADPEAHVRTSAALALGQFSGPAAREALQRVADNDRDSGVRQAARDSLRLLALTNPGGGIPPVPVPVPPVGQPTPAKPASEKYQVFRDPSIQRAFTAQVPAGWKVRGGAMQPRLLTTVFVVEAVSPDGEIVLRLRVNDAPSVHFDGPPPWPLRPDSTHLPITGVGMVPILRYAPGADFFTTYELSQVRGENIRLGKVVTWPHLARSLLDNPLYRRVDAGEVAFQFHRDGKAYQGAALAITRMVATQPGAPQLWQCVWLASYEAPASRVEEAQRHLIRLGSTWQLDPNWVAQQEATQRKSLEIVLRSGQQTAQIISDTYWRRQATYDGIFQRNAEVGRGIVQVWDPRTREEYTVENKSLYYWIRPNGERIGTDDRNPPTPDAEPLIILEVRRP